MTELLVDTYLVSRNRLKSIEDLGIFVNAYCLNDEQPLDQVYLIVNVSLDSEQDYLLDTTDTIGIMITQGGDGPLNFKKTCTILGSIGKKTPQGTEEPYIWHLAIKDWPFLTVELVINCIKLQLDTFEQEIPMSVKKYLPLFFPNIDYIDLLNKCRIGEIALQDNIQNIPTVRDIMFKNATSIKKQKQKLPDVSLPDDLHI